MGSQVFVRPSRRMILVGAGAGLVVLAGCGSKDQPAPAASPGGAAASSAPSKEPAGERTLVVSKYDKAAYSFVAPKAFTVSVKEAAKATVELVATSPKAEVYIELVRAEKWDEQASAAAGEKTEFTTDSGKKAIAYVAGTAMNVAYEVEGENQAGPLLVLFSRDNDVKAPAVFAKPEVQALVKSVQLEPDKAPAAYEGSYDKAGALYLPKDPTSPDSAKYKLKKDKLDMSYTLASATGVAVPQASVWIQASKKSDVAATAAKYAGNYGDTYGPVAQVALGGVPTYAIKSKDGERVQAWAEKDSVMLLVTIMHLKGCEADAYALFKQMYDGLVIDKTKVKFLKS